MLDLKLTFEEDAFIQLNTSQLSQLKNNGEIIIKHLPENKNVVNDNASWLMLAYDNSISDYFFEFNPEKDINLFISSSFITNYFPKTGKIRLIENYSIPLSELLLKHLENQKEIFTINIEEFIIEQEIFTDILEDEALGLLKGKGNFKGMLTCCSCGIAGCSSEYLWAQNYNGLCSFHILSTKLIKVKLYPFKLLK